jgi:GDP-L-fucose synthase
MPVNQSIPVVTEKNASVPFPLAGKNIYIAGIGGMVGSAVSRRLKERDDLKVYGYRSTELDLLNQKDTENQLKKLNIDVLIMAAAKVGGIESNRKFPVEFINNNLGIQNSLFETAFNLKIPRLIFLGSSCIYPRDCPQPIKEEYLLSGKLEDTNRAYAIAKIAGIEQVNAYRKEYGMQWISAMPCNLYGIGDYFNDEKAHVIPGLLKRFHEAKIASLDSVTAWGTGAALREFLNVDELSLAIEFLLENFNGDGHVNVGSGIETSIFELTVLIKNIVGYKGEIFWDHSKPDGTPRKILDNSKMVSLGWQSTSDLSNGLKETYEWMLANYAKIRN